MPALQLVGGLSFFKRVVAPNEFMLGKMWPNPRCGLICGAAITTWARLIFLIRALEDPVFLQ